MGRRPSLAARPDRLPPKCLAALHIAERLDVPAAVSLPLPFFTRTSAFPIPFIGHWPLGARANRASYAFNNVTMLAYGSMINAFRDRLGLSPRPRLDTLLGRDDGTPVPVLYSFSRHLVPVPDDYPDHVHVTGPWFDDQPPNWPPPRDLERFLAAGTPPVYVGFGSMGFGRKNEARTRLLLDAVTRGGHRALIATGWGGLATNPDDLRGGQVHVIESVPHDWLFRRRPP